MFNGYKISCFNEDAAEIINLENVITGLKNNDEQFYSISIYRYGRAREDISVSAVINIYGILEMSVPLNIFVEPWNNVIPLRLRQSDDSRTVEKSLSVKVGKPVITDPGFRCAS